MTLSSAVTAASSASSASGMASAMGHGSGTRFPLAAMPTSIEPA